MHPIWPVLRWSNSILKLFSSHSSFWQLSFFSITDASLPLFSIQSRKWPGIVNAYRGLCFCTAWDINPINLSPSQKSGAASSPEHKEIITSQSQSHQLVMNVSWSVSTKISSTQTKQSVPLFQAYSLQDNKKRSTLKVHVHVFYPQAFHQ